jgi:hypothetical protein
MDLTELDVSEELARIVTANLVDASGTLNVADSPTQRFEFVPYKGTHSAFQNLGE